MYVSHALECNFLQASFTNHVAYDACACQSRSGSTNVLYLLHVQQPRTNVAYSTWQASCTYIYMNRHAFTYSTWLPFAKYFALERRILQARLRKRRISYRLVLGGKRLDVTNKLACSQYSPGMQSIFTSVSQSLEACW